MAVPIIAAGAVGSTLLIVLAIAFIFLVTEPSETMVLMGGAVALAYLLMK